LGLPIKDNQELLDHLNSCPECSRLAEAGEILDKSFDSLRQESRPHPTPLSAIRAKLATQTLNKESNIMAKFKNAISAHPRWGFGLIIGVLALMLFILVPFPYQRVAGYDVRFSGINSQIPTLEFSQSLKALGYEQATIKIMATDIAGEYLISNLPNLKVAKEVAAAFAALTGLAASPTIIPKIETVSGSLFAQARNRIIQIDIDGQGKSDEQIKAEIESKLAAQGFSAPLVYVKTDSTGQKNIRLKIEETDSGPATPQTTIEIDARGKSPEQVQQEIKARLAQQGHPDANVIVEGNGADTLRKFEIRIEEGQKDSAKH
jgi:hypothetical protein